MKIDGGCHCGAITYEAEIDPNNVGVCHCTDCQTLSGSAYRSYAVTVEDGFTLRSGKPKIYVRIAENGHERAQSFCAECGSPIYSTSVGDGPKTYAIRLGTVRQRSELHPRSQIWCRSAQDWVMDLGSVPRMETQP